MYRPRLATVQSGGTDKEDIVQRAGSYGSAGSRGSVMMARNSHPFEDISDDYIEPDDVGEERARELYQ